MTRCALDAWLERGRHTLRDMTIIIGKGHGDMPSDISRKRTLVVGDCASEHRRLGTYLRGCPPMPMETAFAVQKFQGFVPTPMRMRDIGKGYVAGYGWKAARFFKGHDHDLNMGE